MNTSMMKEEKMMATDKIRAQREAQQRLADEVKSLMEHEEHEGLYWSGTSTDLMEALHAAYSTGQLQDEQGICLTFRTIVSRVCSVLHVGQPHNPYECASRGRRRKGMRMNSFMERYERQISRHHEQPIWINISQEKTNE